MPARRSRRICSVADRGSQAAESSQRSFSTRQFAKLAGLEVRALEAKNDKRDKFPDLQFLWYMVYQSAMPV
jgi:hypothetical protein